MTNRKVSKSDAIFISALCLFVLIAGVAISVARRYDRRMKADYTAIVKSCLGAGYHRIYWVDGQWYCIGTEKGSSVAVPVGEVGR